LPSLLGSRVPAPAARHRAGTSCRASEFRSCDCDVLAAASGPSSASLLTYWKVGAPERSRTP